MKPIRKLLASIMPPQKWHVCWIATIPGQGTTHGDVVAVIHEPLDVDKLRADLAIRTSEAASREVAPGQINITGLCRIG